MKRPNRKDYINKSTKIQLIADQEIYIDFLEKQLETINYNRCCMELKSKEAPTFDEWLKKWKWKQIGSSYTFKRGESYTDAESLLISYKKEHYSL